MAFENAEIMLHGPQEGEEERDTGETVTRVPGRGEEEKDFWDTHAGPSNIRNERKSGSGQWELIRGCFAGGWCAYKNVLGHLGEKRASEVLRPKRSRGYHRLFRRSRARLLFARNATAVLQCEIRCDLEDDGGR